LVSKASWPGGRDPVKPPVKVGAGWINEDQWRIGEIEIQDRNPVG
jgi:hypothetical protein